MKKFHRTFFLILISAVIVFCFAACGSGGSNGEKGSGAGSGILNDISIKDIEWNVDEGIVDGERFILLDYTNHTKFTIVGFELQFKAKKGITDEEKDQFYNDLIDRLDIDTNDSEEMEDLEEVKKVPIAMHAESEIVTKAGESASAVNLEYYDGYYDVTDIDHYSLVVPDIATIKYIDDSVVKTVYYDFSSGKYSTENNTEVAFYWTDNGLEKIIPKPEADYVIECGRDDSDCFMFEVYGWSLDQFNAYVDSCKEKGFTVDPGEYEGFYSADNSEGYNVYMYYDEDTCSMSCIASTEAENADE